MIQRITVKILDTLGSLGDTKQRVSAYHELLNATFNTSYERAILNALPGQTVQR